MSVLSLFLLVCMLLWLAQFLVESSCTLAPLWLKASSLPLLQYFPFDVGLMHFEYEKP